jgi:hypothetical protein
MYSIYQDALLQREKVSICGVKIGDLTVAQSAVLWAMENPFVFSAKGTLAHFCTALIVLQKKYPFNDYNDWINESLKLRKKVVKMKQAEIDAEMQVLMEYFKFNSKTHPRGFAPNEGNKTPVIPWQWSVVFALRRYFKENDIDAWNTPLLRAMCYHATICHSLGDDTLYNDMECEIRDQNVAEEKEIKNG